MQIKDNWYNPQSEAVKIQAVRESARAGTT